MNSELRRTQLLLAALGVFVVQLLVIFGLHAALGAVAPEAHRELRDLGVLRGDGSLAALGLFVASVLAWSILFAWAFLAVSRDGGAGKGGWIGFLLGALFVIPKLAADYSTYSLPMAAIAAWCLIWWVGSTLSGVAAASLLRSARA